MTITALPNPPSTLRPDAFALDMDTFLAALPVLVTELNATASALGLSLSSVSTTSVVFGTGSKTFGIEQNKGFVPGMELVIASTATPASRMIGTVTGYSASTGSLSVNVTSSTGTGTLSAWTISVTTAFDASQFVTPAGVQTLTNKTLTSPALGGVPTTPTAAVGTSTTQVASTAFVSTAIANAGGAKAPLASPALTGTPTVPTAAVGTATTQAASTAFVNAQIAATEGPGRASFTASGGIPAGSVVVLNADGTISTVAASVSSFALGPEQVQVASALAVLGSLSIPGTDKIIIAYQGFLVVGQIDPATNTVTCGTPVALAAVTSGVTWSMCWHPVEDKLVVCYSASSVIYMVLGTVTGTTLALGTPSSGGACYSSSKSNVCYNAHQNKLVVVYGTTANTVNVRAAAVSGATVTWYTMGGTTNITGWDLPMPLCDVPGQPYCVLSGYSSTFSRTVILVITVNATAVSVSSPVIASSIFTAAFITWSAAASKAVLFSTTNTYLIISVASGVITAGAVGTLPQFGAFQMAADYDAGKGKIVVFGRELTTNYGITVSYDISGATLVGGSVTYINSTTTPSMAVAYNADTSRAVFSYKDDGNFGYVSTRTVATGDTSTNANYWVGIADAAIASGATGRVTTKGGTCTSVTGLTPRYLYYIDDFGALQQSGSRVAGLALSATKLLLSGNA